MTVKQDAAPCVFVCSCYCMHLSLSLSMHHMYHCTDIYRNMMKYVHMSHQACDRDDARRSMHVELLNIVAHHFV